jgi:hypothetical protein
MVTRAVAELSTQTQEQGRTPRRRVVHWRYGMGFVVLLASISSLVLVGQIAGWIQNPHESAQAEASVEYRALALQSALRTLPPSDGGAGGSASGHVGGVVVPEAAYADAVRAAQGMLLDVEYPSVPGSAPSGITVRLAGMATSGVLSGRHVTLVTRCFHYGWVSSPETAVYQQVACPGGIVEPAIRTGTAPGASPDPTPTSGSSGSGGTSGSGGPDQSGARASLLGLSLRLAALPRPQKAVSADDSGTRQLLAAAQLPPGTLWDAAYPQQTGTGGVRDTALAIGSGGSAGCLFVDVHAGTLTAWVAPLSAPCTAVRASRAVLSGDPAG